LKPLKKSKILLPDELNYLTEYYKKDFGQNKIFYDYFHFGQTFTEIEAVLKKEKFDIYGISSNFTAYYEQSFKIAEIIKKINKHAFIIIGGNNSRIMYEYFLKSGFVDVVVFGEGEFTLLKVIENLNNLSIVENIAFTKNNKITINHFNKNFDINKTTIRLDKINPENYKIGKFRSLSIITTKGCPYHCSYCTANINCLSSFQQKEIQLVFNDIDYNVKKHQINALNIEDENFSYNHNYALDFLKKKIKFYPDLYLYFMNGLHYTNLNEDILYYLKKANLNNLNLALVDIENTKLISRSFNQKKFAQIIKKAKELNFLITVYFIAGLPGQNKKNILDMIRFLKELNVVIGMSIYYPIPLTKLYQKYQNEFKSLSFTQMRSTALPYETSELTRYDLVELLYYTRAINLSISLAPTGRGLG